MHGRLFEKGESVSAMHAKRGGPVLSRGEALLPGRQIVEPRGRGLVVDLIIDGRPFQRGFVTGSPDKSPGSDSADSLAATQSPGSQHLPTKPRVRNEEQSLGKHRLPMSWRTFRPRGKILTSTRRFLCISVQLGILARRSATINRFFATNQGTASL